MRCENCGWDNPQGSHKCEKCNSPLINYNQTIIDSGRFHAAPPAAQPPVQDSIHCERCGYPLSASNAFCPNCGFMPAKKPHSPEVEELKKTIRAVPEDLKATVREIPQSLIDDTPQQMAPAAESSPVPEVHDAAQYKKTVRILPEELMKEAAEVAPAPSFKLVPMDNFDGKTPMPLDFSGNEVTVVKKDITSADSSIPEDLQSAFEYKDGVWSIESKGGQKAIYVCTSNKIMLNEGDIVVIGNRRFIFE